MDKPDLTNLISALNRQRYRVFDTPTVDWNLNIVGIRASSLSPNEFDDWLVVFHKFLGDWDARFYRITTDPSPYYLRNPIEPAGTAVLKPGQYTGAYSLDIHKRGKPGAHKALCQRNATVTIYRDNQRNGLLNLDPNTIENGMFGINIHRGPRNGNWDDHNTHYSAGCQVFSDDRKFDEFLKICEIGAKSFGNKFTYTLLDENELYK